MFLSAKRLDVKKFSRRRGRADAGESVSRAELEIKRNARRGFSSRSRGHRFYSLHDNRRVVQADTNARGRR